MLKHKVKENLIPNLTNFTPSTAPNCLIKAICCDSKPYKTLEYNGIFTLFYQQDSRDLVAVGKKDGENLHRFRASYYTKESDVEKLLEQFYNMPDTVNYMSKIKE